MRFKFGKNKFKNKKAKSIDGYNHRSKLEADVANMLLAMKASGNIKSFKREVPVLMTKAKIKYIADFCVENFEGGHYFIEAKGIETPVWRIKRRLWEHYGEGRLEVWKHSRQGVYMAECITTKN